MTTKQKTIMMTGASQGIGAAAPYLFLDRGHNVVGNSRKISRKNELQRSDNLALVDGDIGLASTAQMIVDTALKRFASVDALMNNVGTFFAKPFTEHTPEDFRTRDQLAEDWQQFYKGQIGSNLPAEEIVRLEQGHDYGWPECYFDGFQKKLVLAPEYGGDGGKKVDVCATRTPPIAFFPAHWAPNDLLIASNPALPAVYREGAFVAFHGSWNRAPAPQEGYNVVFQPMKDGKAAGSPVGADLTAGAWLWSDGSLEGLTKTISQGVATPKKHLGAMPPMGGSPLSAADLKAVSAYVWSIGHPH